MEGEEEPTDKAESVEKPMPPFKYEVTVSATALHLLKSPSEDHRAYKEEQFPPCCGFNIFEKNDGSGDVVVLGCPNGVDWDPVHSTR